MRVVKDWAVPVVAILACIAVFISKEYEIHKIKPHCDAIGGVVIEIATGGFACLEPAP